MNFDEIILKQREYWNVGNTLDVKFRKKMLNRLYDTVKKYQTEIKDALKQRRSFRLLLIRKHYMKQRMKLPKHMN